MEKILFILMAHMAGDYLFQSNYLATNKGKDNYILLSHSILYTLAIMSVGYLFSIQISTINLFLIGAIHFPVDFLKAKGVTVRWLGDKKALILDQVIHYVTLILFI